MLIGSSNRAPIPPEKGDFNKEKMKKQTIELKFQGPLLAIY